MLSHLRHRVGETLASANKAMLSTFGPADIQAAEVTCMAHGMRLYVLLPQTSDLLFNIESHASVVVSTPTWQLHGCAQLLNAAAWPPVPGLPPPTEAGWQVLAEIRPTRLHIHAGPHGPETIDVDLA
jgi:hypothetical protein